MFSNDIAIRVDNLSKCYEIYANPRDRLKQFVMHRLQRLAGRESKQYFREFWALKDVSFAIKKGETVGIIGRNGSGKSTLLQMICGTLNPTSGSIKTNGRIAALLELGSGFNPEFTGRENVYMNASVLGLSNEEIDARFDAIAAIAEIDHFIDQPVKTYSSGMMVRLAFAVAINVDPEILIVDEALSVGDELFQRKCFSRIEAIRAAGATILFVSHSGGSVVELCDRALLLDSGERLAMGSAKKMVGCYQKLLYAPTEVRDSIRSEIRFQDSQNGKSNEISDQSEEPTYNKKPPPLLIVSNTELSDSYDPSLKPTSTIAYASHGALIEDPAIYSIDGKRVNNLTRGKAYRYRYRVEFLRVASNVRFGMMIKTTNGTELGGAASAASNRTSLPFVTAGSVYAVDFEFFCRMNAGIYFLNAGVVGDLNGSETYLHRLIDVAVFRVISESDTFGNGVIDFTCTPRVELEAQ